MRARSPNDVSRRPPRAARAALSRVRLRRADRARRDRVSPPLRRSRRPRAGRAAHDLPGLRPRRSVRPAARRRAGAHGALAGGVRARLRRAAGRRSSSRPSSIASTGPRDLVAFCMASRDLLARHGTLEKVFVAGDAEPHGPIRPGPRAVLARLPRGRSARRVSARPDLAGLSSPVSAARPPAAPASGCTCSCAGWCGASRPDLGLWTSVSPARLLMPIDTHVENMSRALGPHAPPLAHLADGRGDHREAGRARSRRSGEVRLRALPHAHGG